MILKISLVIIYILFFSSTCMLKANSMDDNIVKMVIVNNEIPSYAKSEAERYKKEFLQNYSHSASDLTYRFFYNTEGEACLEYTVTPKERYTWDKKTWVGYRWGSLTGGVGNNKIRYSKTRQREDEAQRRLEERRLDPVFSEIEKVVFQIAQEYDYDFLSAYNIRVKYRNKNVKKSACEGYADAVMRAFKNHPLVQKVEKWSGSEHAWNVIYLNDGRKLYCDVTWYDGNKIDKYGYVVNIPFRNPVSLTFDVNEFNSLGGAVNTASGKMLSVHFGWSGVKLDEST